MLHTCYRPIGRCLGRRTGDSLLWHKDLKPHASGDFSIAVVQANSSLEDQAQVLTSPSTTYIGVYDGHGGPDASRFITTHLFPHLHEFATEQGGLSADVIKKSFDATEEKFLQLVKQSWPARPQIVSVGSCCLVGAIKDGILYVANLGDSRAVLGRKAVGGPSTRGIQVQAERLSTDHNVGEEEVRREVKEQHPDDLQIVVHSRGVWRIKGIIQMSHFLRVHLILKKMGSHCILMRYHHSSSCLKSKPHQGCFVTDISSRHEIELLQLCPPLILHCWLKIRSPVSRSIGDVYLKKPEFTRDPLYQQFAVQVPLKRSVMSAEPSIQIRKLKQHDLFLIFASDGLWEQLSDEMAVEIVFKSPRAGIAKRLVRAALTEAARKREMRYDDIKRIEKGIRRHFHDDISVIVIYLDHHLRPSRFKGSTECTNSPVDIFSHNAGVSDEDPFRPVS